MSKDPNSPFNWRMRTGPSIFAKDPYFRAKVDGLTDSQRVSQIVETRRLNGKIPVVVYGLGNKDTVKDKENKLLAYKQFGTYSRAQPSKKPNKHEVEK